MTPAEITKQTSIRAIKRLLLVPQRDHNKAMQAHHAWQLMAGPGWTCTYPHERRSEYLAQLMHPLVPTHVSLILGYSKFSGLVSLDARPLVLQLGQVFALIRTLPRNIDLQVLIDCVYRDSTINKQRCLHWDTPDYEGLTRMSVKVDTASTKYKDQMLSLISSIRSFADQLLVQVDTLRRIAATCDAQTFLAAWPYLLAWRAGWDFQKYDEAKLVPPGSVGGTDPIHDTAIAFSSASGDGPVGTSSWQPPTHSMIVKGTNLVDTERTAAALLQAIVGRSDDGAAYDMTTALKATLDARDRYMQESF